MQMDIIKIGNSKGIRLPLAVLKQCGIDSKVELEIQNNCIIIRPIKNPRRGWDEAFERMHQNDDDVLVIPDELDDETLRLGMSQSIEQYSIYWADLNPTRGAEINKTSLV